MHPLIILAGPTASGKSETALALAETLDSEIISADSMQVYKYFDIGTSKPAKEIRKKVPHHLTDLLEPHEEFNAFEFKSHALKHTNNLIRRNKIPIIVGGTGLYLKVLLKDFECAVLVSPEIRNKVKSDMKEKGIKRMHEELARIDPQSAEKILPTDPLRIERALSVYSQTGQPMSRFHAGESQAAFNFKPYFFGLDWDRSRLYKNIEARVDSMMHRGWVDEVRKLLKRGFDKGLKPFQGIGYAQIVKHLEEEVSLEQTVGEIKQETRRYAKRQLTWLRKVPDLISIPAEQGVPPERLKERILSHLPKGAALFLAACLLLIPPANTHAGNLSLYQEGLRFFKKGEYDTATLNFFKARRYLQDERESKRAAYLLGIIAARQGRQAKAIDYFKKALNEFPEIEDYIRYELAESYYQAGKNQQALEEIKRLLKNFNSTRYFPQAELRRAEILQQLGKTSQAIGHLVQAIKRLSKMGNRFKPYLPELMFKLAQLHESEKAFAWYKKLYINYPTHPLTATAISRMIEWSGQPITATFKIDKKERQKRIRSLMANADFSRAVEEIDQVIGSVDPAKRPAQYYIYLARAYKGMGNRLAAQKALRAFHKHYPGHRRTQEVMFLLGRNYWNLEEDQKAIEQFRSLIKIYPKSHLAIKGRFFLGKIFEANKQYQPAREQYSFLETHYGSSEFGQKAAWQLGWLDYRKKEYANAITQFKKNAARLPTGDFVEANLFWMAKALEKAGRPGQALKVYQDLLTRFPYTYHGIQAKKKLINGGSHATQKNTRPEGRIVRVSLTEAADSLPLPAPLSSKAKWRNLRAREMIAMGLMANASFEIKQFEGKVRKNYAGTLWMANLYHQAESYPQAYRLLELFKNFKTKLREKELPSRFWRLFYPLAYAQNIHKHAKIFDVDPFRANSVIRQESMFDKNSRSTANARGLMQIMPHTGERLFAETFIQPKTFHVDDLFDPDLNIHLGMRYLKELKEKYDNNWIHILICYNAGPEALENWLERFREIDDPDVFIEMIPYPETRNFVKRVLRNYGVYKNLYS